MMVSRLLSSPVEIEKLVACFDHLHSTIVIRKKHLWDEVCKVLHVYFQKWQNSIYMNIVGPIIGDILHCRSWLNHV